MRLSATSRPSSSSRARHTTPKPPAPRRSSKAAAPQPAVARPGSEPPRPRRPSQGTLALDQHTVMVRRRVAAGIGVVLLIVTILIVNGCLKNEKQKALRNYNRDAGQIV